GPNSISVHPGVKYKIEVCGTVINNCDYSDNYFSFSSNAFDFGCSYGTKYSNTTGKLCINVINDNKIHRTLRWGDVGEDVKILQRYLGLSPDGVYGRGTVTKVKTWQSLNGIYPDGVFGSASRIKAGL
ncbi:peptidoglycan-binding protein, partial [Candidatus Nomurabacteria bacterium]|nr:peptidoglycan-binding protein [Candidatus Nomurabacteria bacterium]